MKAARSTSLTGAWEGVVKEISLDQVLPDPDQPRKYFNNEALATLAGSIEKHGLLQPPLVRPLGDGYYQIVHGERRYRAHRLLGWKTISVEVRELTDEQVHDIRLTANQKPLDKAKIRSVSDEETVFLAMRINDLPGLRMDDFERGKQLSLLQEKFGWSQEKLDGFQRKRVNPDLKEVTLPISLTGMSDSLNPNSPKTKTIATRFHSPRSATAASASPRHLWQLTFQRPINRKNGKNRGNSMLNAGEKCQPPLFQGSESIERGVLFRLCFVILFEFESHFKLFFQVGEEV